MFHGDLNRDGSAATGGGNMLTLAWSYCTGAGVLSSPIVSAGVVYVASTNGILAALVARSGQLLWQFRAGGPLYSSPAIQNGVVYIGALDGFVYAVDTVSGHLRWRSSADDPGAKIWSSPVVAGGLVIVGAASTLSEKPKIPGEVLAFDAATGVLRWRTWSEPGGAPGGGIWSSPAVDATKGVVYVGMGDPDDGAEALDLHDGHVIWRWRSVPRDVADTDVGSGPLLYHDQRGQLRLAVGGKDGFLYSLGAQSGRVLWHTRVGDHVFSSPAFVRGTIYIVAVLIRRSVSWAIDAETGTPRWQHAIPTIVYASPATAGQALYIGEGDAFGPGDGGVEVLEATTGNRLQYADLHSAATSSPAVIESWLYVGAQDGNLFAFVRSG
jgi:serine/threonine-protein kinase